MSWQSMIYIVISTKEINRIMFRVQHFSIKGEEKKFRRFCEEAFIGETSAIKRNRIAKKNPQTKTRSFYHVKHHQKSFKIRLTAFAFNLSMNKKSCLIKSLIP